MRYNRTILSCAMAASMAAANAETVLMQEDFNDDYTKSQAYTYDADRCEPHKSIAQIFYSNFHQCYMPWWIARDNSTTTDRYMASHSYYSEPNESEDWMIMHPVIIDTEGYVLEFDAQSLPVRTLENLSDLCVFITEDVIDVKNIPQTPTKVFEKIPYGEDPDQCENDWTHYTMSLDEWAGKTIYVNFVNRNDDKDILCLDNVKISRPDLAIIKMDPLDTFTSNANYPVSVTVSSASDAILTNYTLTLNVKEGSEERTVQTWTGDIAAGESEKFTADVALNPKVETEVYFTFECDGQSWQQTVSDDVTLLAFEPVHRVFVEETTSLHCGNCPMGMYTFESLLEDEEYGNRFLPVSVHISGLGFDPMASSDYFSNLPKYDAAPLVFVDRYKSYDSFIPAYDLEYDTSNSNSFAYRIASRIDAPTFLGVDVEAKWVTEGEDTTAIKCTAKVTPAIDIAEGDFRVAFILTENNVGLDNNRYWIQENYLSGVDTPSRAGGWSDLPSYVINARYHDVARAISSYDGHLNSLPSEMNASEDYTFSYTLDIPDTRNMQGTYTVSNAINNSNCQITAIVIEHSSGMVVNAARVSMSPEADKRISIKDLAGINDVISDNTEVVKTEYFDINGRKVARPQTGFYIQRDTMSDGSVRSQVRH